jgi:predicted MarR family transcription regulator
MTTLTITDTRAELLRAIADPNIEVYAAIAALRGSWSTADVWIRRGGSLEQKVTGKIRKLETAGLVKRGQPGARYHEPRHYTLTDAGRKALAEYDATTGQQP